MTTDLVVAPEQGALEADPVGYMSVVLHRAKGWLAEAQSIDAVRETKAIAVGYESVIREKELAFDAQLSATEIVRRCERRIGELVREGQERGEIRKVGEHDAVRNQHMDGAVLRSAERSGAEDYYSNHSEWTDSTVLGSADEQNFEAAIEDAKAEGNLSRANVVRKVKGEKKDKPEARNVSITSRPAAVLRVAAQASALALPLTAINLTTSCARLTPEERADALEKCKTGRKAINALVAALAAASETEDS